MGGDVKMDIINYAKIKKVETDLDALITALNSTTDGSSGADKLGMTAIEGLDGETVQAIIESLRNKLKSTTDGASGADFVAATGITGLTGETVQTLLEALKNYIDTHKASGDHDGKYYSKTEVADKLDMTNGAPKSIDGVSNAKGDIDLIGGTGITITPNNTAKTITIAATGETHASSHASGGSDPVTPASIGAATATALSDLAGTGRTTETVKGNADAIATHLAETATSQDLGHVKVDGTTITSDGGILSASVETVIASLPAHYERDIPWAKKSGSNTVLQSPSKMTVNINNSGYRITSQAELNLATASNWDTTSPTDYTTAANRAGKNFYVYACQPESGSTPVLKLSANSTVPSDYTASNSRKIAGFHCLCVDVGTISDHPLSGYVAGDILPASVWDLKHRPKCNPEGMVYSEAAEIWVDIYLQSGTGASTASVYGATIKDTRNWMDFVDDGGAVKKQLLTDTEFQLIAAGSNEGTNISGSVDPDTTGGHKDTNDRRMISNIGCEDCCGVMYQWLNEQSTRWDGTGGWQWTDPGGGKGQLYLGGDINDVKLLAGAAWANGAYSGSRSRIANLFRWATASHIGCRLRAEPA